LKNHASKSTAFFWIRPVELQRCIQVPVLVDEDLQYVQVVVYRHRKFYKYDVHLLVEASDEKRETKKIYIKLWEVWYTSKFRKFQCGTLFCM
jgi:hypothetical protein